MSKASKEKRERVLGMSSGKASGILKKMLIFDFAEKAGHKCYRCGGELTLATISIEHKIPYLNSDKPKDLFFDLDNIAFSHLKCNSSAITTKIILPIEGKIKCKGCDKDKDKDQFIKSKKSEGYKGKCKTCRNEKRRQKRIRRSSRESYTNRSA